MSWGEASSTPVEDLRGAFDLVKSQTGFKPHTHVISPKAVPGSSALCIECGCVVIAPARAGT